MGEPDGCFAGAAVDDFRAGYAGAGLIKAGKSSPKTGVCPKETIFRFVRCRNG